MNEYPPLEQNKVCPQADRLLAWHAGELEPAEAAGIMSHVESCPDCQVIEQDVLAEEQEVLHLFSTLDPAPELLPERTAAFSRLTATINDAALLAPDASASTWLRSQQALEAEQQHSQQKRRNVSFQVRQFGRIFKLQIPIINRSIWWSTALVMFGGCLLSILSSWNTAHAALGAAAVLNLFSTISTAVGITLLYGKEHDPAYELTISTPTSIRYIMLSRFLLVVSYNALLSLASSLVIVTIFTGDLWSVISLWLGPMLLVASFAMMLVVLIGSGIAMLGSLILEASQTFQTRLDHIIPVIGLAPSANWQTNPLIIALALLCILTAILSAGRQPQLAQ